MSLTVADVLSHRIVFARLRRRRASPILSYTSCVASSLVSSSRPLVPPRSALAARSSTPPTLHRPAGFAPLFFASLPLLSRRLPSHPSRRNRSVASVGGVAGGAANSRIAAAHPRTTSAARAAAAAAEPIVGTPCRRRSPRNSQPARRTEADSLPGDSSSRRERTHVAPANARTRVQEQPRGGAGHGPTPHSNAGDSRLDFSAGTGTTTRASRHSRPSSSSSADDTPASSSSSKDTSSRPAAASRLGSRFLSRRMGGAAGEKRRHRSVS